MTHEEFARKLAQRAHKKGADQAEAWLESTRESSVRVRDGEVEDLTQATSKGVGLRVIRERRLGFTYTSEFDPTRIDELVDRALAAARIAAPDRSNGLPASRDLADRNRSESLDLFDPQVAELPGEWLVEASRAAEKAARGLDPRVKVLESVGAGNGVSEVFFCTSEGVSDRFRSSSIYVWAAPVASDGEQLQTGHWLDNKRFLSDLEAPEAIGKRAAQRAVRMLGARKVKTCRVPVVLDPFMAASFIGGLAGAVNGDMVFKKASFLADKLGKRIAPESVTVIDDGRMARGLGTSPFDGEGVPTRRTPVVERGVLGAFLYDCATARKARARTTGNAARSYASLPGIGLNNFHLCAGTPTPQEILAPIRQGFYVTAMLGRGANPVTGEYSRGANGLWIVDGELAYPVQEVTVAGNLLEMLQTIDAVGNDLEFRGSVAAPTLRLAEAMVSGA
ncbi:MAG: TldD/PmbA family protein [Deltaproteobacteria bacterium]|nr:TldD/PmbA family protein [Deltaproteobacteria bacterium]